MFLSISQDIGNKYDRGVIDGHQTMLDNFFPLVFSYKNINFL